MAFLPSECASRSQGEKEDPQQEVRTSDGTFMHSSDEPTGVLKRVEARIAR